MANLNDDRYFRHRQGQRNKIKIVAGHICKVDNCGEPATLSKTIDGLVKRSCSIHWNPVKIRKHRDREATMELLRKHGLA